MSEPLRFRKIPDTPHAYWFDIAAEGLPPELVGEVRRTRGRPFEDPTWRSTSKDGTRTAYGRSREQAVRALLSRGAAAMSEPNADYVARPLVWFIPEQPGRMVTMHACWGADFAGETAVFPTEAEAVAFAHKRWRRAPRIDRRGAPIDGSGGGE